MHQITCHHLALSLVSDSLRLLRRLTRWSALERSTRCSDAPWMIRWAATSWPSRHWQPTHATTIKGSHNLKIDTQNWERVHVAAAACKSSVYIVSQVRARLLKSSSTTAAVSYCHCTTRVFYCSTTRSTTSRRSRDQSSTFYYYYSPVLDQASSAPTSPASCE